MKDNNNASKKKGIKVYIPLILVIAVMIAGAMYWYSQYSKFIKTDDAYVDTDNISVSSKMLGRISQTFVEEGDLVYKGEILALLDSSSMLAQRQQAMAAKKQAEANLIQTEAQYDYSKESIKVLEVNLNKSKSDLARAKSQFNGGVLTQEQFDHYTQANEAAQAQYNAGKTQLKVVKASIETAKASIGTAEASIAVIETQLENTKLYAPIDGVIAKRWLLQGDVVQPSQSVYTITNNKKHWVMVYLEETKISNIHLNQDVQFTIDAFPGELFTGKVFYVGSNTASQFSLIPPSNASGNFTKVTQRVPIKVSIDGTEDQKKIDSFEILAGMSVMVKIIRN